MLLASAKHPAMLLYLNNEESTKYAPNENYGRELLELHTVGVDGGYDEDDIYSSARILTGLTLRNPKPGPRRAPRGRAASSPSTRRSTTPAAGRSSASRWSSHAASTGLTQAENYITYLAKHRKTAERIANKLAIRFVSDSPPPSLVSRLADVYQANDTAIVPVLRALFTSREFTYSSGMKVRRPYEDLVAGLRALDVRPSTNPDFPADGDPSYFEGMSAVYYQSRDLGHAPLNWGPPNGYPDTAKDWQSANGVLGRWNNHRSHVNGWWPSATDKGFLWPPKPTVPKQAPGVATGWRATCRCAGLSCRSRCRRRTASCVDGLSVRLLQQRMRHGAQDGCADLLRQDVVVRAQGHRRRRPLAVR